jgi:hypothetical protein
MDDLLTDEEINKLTELWIPTTHGTTLAVAIARAQSAKTKVALVEKNWKSPEEVSQFLDDHVRITNRAVDQARIDERKAIGEQLHWALEISPKVIPQYVNTLLKGESPNG